MPTSLILLPVLYFVVPDVDHLTLRAEPAVAIVPRQASGRRLVQMPALAYRIEVETRCASGKRPQSISISVADTRATLTGDDLLGGSPFTAAIEVSPQQLAPLAIQNFCARDGSGGESMLVRAVLTANVSLRCASSTQQTIRFETRALDVSIECEAVAEPVADDAGD